MKNDTVFKLDPTFWKIKYMRMMQMREPNSDSNTAAYILFTDERDDLHRYPRSRGKSSENWSTHVGAEATLAEMFSLRLGYDGSVEVDNNAPGTTTDRGTSGMTLGADFQTNGLEVDYTWTPFGKIGDNHRIGLNYKF